MPHCERSENRFCCVEHLSITTNEQNEGAALDCRSTARNRNVQNLNTAVSAQGVQCTRRLRRNRTCLQHNRTSWYDGHEPFRARVNTLDCFVVGQAGKNDISTTCQCHKIVSDRGSIRQHTLCLAVVSIVDS